MRCCLIFLGVLVIAFAAIGAAAQNTAGDTGPRSPFRYVIIENKIDPKMGAGDEDRRVVEVVMDAKSFSRNNLITLFNLISERFPKPRLTYINVFTDLNDVETPEERDQPKISERDTKDSQSGDMAIFIGSGKKKFFIYIFKTEILKR